jgi:signal transduction histidine kinase
VPLVRVVAWALTYALAAWAGERAIMPGTDFPLVWPASGIAAVWISTSVPGRRRAGELAVLAALSAVATRALGGNAWETGEALVAVPVAAATFAVLARRWAPGVWTGAARELRTLRQYGALAGAALVAGLAECLVAAATLWPAPGRPLERVGEIGLTHTVAMISLGGGLIALGGWFSGLPGGPSPAHRVLAGVRRDNTRTDALMALVAVTLGVAVFLTGYVWFEQAPVSFVLVMVVVAVGIRFSAATTALYSILVVGVACWLTVQGHGPIAALPEPHRRGLAFGLFTAALTLTGLTVSLSRRERDATIAQLRESEHAAEVIADDLRLVLANLQEGVAVVEEGGRFIHANAAIGRLLELPDFDDERVAPVDSYHLVHPDGTPLLESEVPHVRAFAGDEHVHDVLHLNRPDVPGERILEVWSRALPRIRDTDKPRAVTMIRDVTAEQQRRDALTAFAHVVAHDLRNPLTSVQLWAQELLDTYAEGPVEPEVGTMMLQHVVSGAGRMQSFISDLLAYAVARDQTPSPVKVELADVVRSVVETISAADGTQLDVHYDALPGVWCDPVLMPQLFDNLIGNARKYVAPGVVPRVCIEATTLPDDWARVRVIDNGIGIRPDDRVRVFETFERANTGDYDGTGLGLAICRHIVVRHGGTIAVANPPAGSGTCIELTLPMTDSAFDRATASASTFD